MKNKNYYREIRKSFWGVKKGNQRLFAKVLKAFEKIVDLSIANNGFNSRFYLEPEHLIGWVEYCERRFNLSKQSIYVNSKGEEVYRPIPATTNTHWEWEGIPKKTISLYKKLYKRYK